MFEAFVTLCFLADDANCRDALLPGYAAMSKEKCLEKLRVDPPVLNGTDLRCVERPPPNLIFEEIASGVFAHRGMVAEPSPQNSGDVANIGFIVGAETVMVIDSGGSRRVAEDIYLAIRAVTEMPISHLVLTHMHPDHVLGATVFQEVGAAIVGHSNLPRALSDRSGVYQANFQRLIGDPAFLGSRIIGPDQTVETETEIDLGARKVTLVSWPAAHTDNDLTVYDKKSGVLFTGDMVFDDHAPALDGSLVGWRQTLEVLISHPARVVVPGHGDVALNWPQDSAPLRRYLGVLETDTRAAIETGLSLGAATGIIAQSEANHWRLFDLFNPRNATVAYTELEWE